LESLNVSTALTSIPEPAWASPFASALLNAPEGESGSNRNPAEVRRFSLRSPAENLRDKDPSHRAFSILLVEDNAADAGLVREALEEHAVEGELVHLRDGHAAIGYIQGLEAASNCPDLVIVDLNLPKRSGRDVLQEIRQSRMCRDSAVVVLSSSDAKQDEADSLALGASRYIRKPLQLEEFLGLGAVFKAMLEE
jgi:CheY-like chemotaxis protein